MGLIARVHTLQRDRRHPTIADLVFHDEHGHEDVAATLGIDVLALLGVSLEAVADICNGEDIEVVAFAAYELTEREGPDG